MFQVPVNGGSSDDNTVSIQLARAALELSSLHGLMPDDGTIGIQVARGDSALPSDASGDAASVASSGAEARESIHEGERIAEELERRSNTSSVASSSRMMEQKPVQDSCEQNGEGSRLTALSVLPTGALLRRSGGSSSDVSVESRQSAEKLLLDHFETALHDAKRGFLSRELTIDSSCSASTAGSNMSDSGSLFARQSNAGSSGVIPVSNLLPPLIVEALPEDARSAIEVAVAKMVFKSGQELADLQAALDQSRHSAAGEQNKLLEMEARCMQLQSKASSGANLSESLVASRKSEARVVDERDGLLDKLAGMEARLNAKTERHEKEIHDMRLHSDDVEAGFRAKSKAEKHTFVKELNMARKQMERAKTQSLSMSNERDFVRRAESVSRQVANSEMHTMKAELEAAMMELDRRRASGDTVSEEENINERIQLGEVLREQQQRNMNMTNDLASLRIEMLHMYKQKDDELEALRTEVDSASSSALVIPHSAEAFPNRRRQQRASSGILPGIDEGDGDDDIKSQAASGISGQVSSGGDEVGDLCDFDDIVALPLAGDKDMSDKAEVLTLFHELQAAESAFKNLKDDQIAQVAQHASATGRLTELLVGMREEAAASKDEFEIGKQLADEAGMQKDTELLFIKHRLKLHEAKESEDAPKMKQLADQVRDFAERLDEAQHQLAFVSESKRLLERRLADSHAEIQAMEARHIAAIRQLDARLQLATGSGSTGRDLLDRLQSAEEERNVFRNELECQKVHWHTQLESEQQEIVILRAKLQSEKLKTNKDKEARANLEENLKEQQRLLALARKAQRAAEQRANREASRAKSAEQKAAEMAAEKSWMTRLRCPLRSNVAEQIAHSIGRAQDSSTDKNEASASNVQVMVWQTIANMGSTTALLCNSETLKIIDASKKAVALWGSTALRVSSLTTLVVDKEVASWLESELTWHTSPFTTPVNVKGFWLRELGCVHFRSKLGSGFESSVTAARLPEEPPDREPVVLIVVEPLEVQDQQTGQPAAAQSHTGVHRRAGSMVSSVESEDITPNDSASNVHARCGPRQLEG